MSLNQVPSGRDLPDDFNVIIEIAAHSDPVKYEVDKDSGALFVDRFMGASMVYPCNYGYIPNTLSDDGDPMDVLVRTPHQVNVGSVLRCRPIAMLDMEDDGGVDYKILALPVPELTPFWKHVKTREDMPDILIKQIEHFYTHYKDLEEGKWAKINGWRDKEAARQAILKSVENYKNGAR